MAKDLLIFIKLIFILTLIKRDYADGGETVSMKKSLSNRFLFTWESNREEQELEVIIGSYGDSVFSLLCASVMTSGARFVKAKLGLS